LDAEPLTDPSSLPPLTPPPPVGIASVIFLNEKGLRAGWRLVLYAIFVAALGFSGGMVLRHFAPSTRGVFSPRYLFAGEIFSFAVVFGAALIMSRIEHRSPGAYGLPAKGAFGKLFWQGFLIGLVEISALVGLISAFGGYSFGTLALHGSGILRWAIVWTIFFVIVGLFEEFMFRGYTQFTLADGIGFWPAAILLSVSFGAVHLSNPGEGWVGAAAVVMIGLIFALTLQRTGNLWFAVGLHASFDFGETFLYSVPNSGIVFDGHLSNASLHGAKWLTGGTVGPEGSVFSFLTMAVLGLVVHWLYPAKSSNPSPN
jgi:membrane protease YdiL (CAAX protease family)